MAYKPLSSFSGQNAFSSSGRNPELTPQMAPYSMAPMRTALGWGANVPFPGATFMDDPVYAAAAAARDSTYNMENRPKNPISISVMGGNNSGQQASLVPNRPVDTSGLAAINAVAPGAPASPSPAMGYAPTGAAPAAAAPAPTSWLQDLMSGVSSLLMGQPQKPQFGPPKPPPKPRMDMATSATGQTAYAQKNAQAKSTAIQKSSDPKGNSARASLASQWGFD